MEKLEEEKAKVRSAPDGSDNNQIVNEDYRIVDLFRSDLVVNGVDVDVGEEGGQGDQQGHLKRKYQRKTETSKKKS